MRRGENHTRKEKEYFEEFGRVGYYSDGEERYEDRMINIEEDLESLKKKVKKTQEENIKEWQEKMKKREEYWKKHPPGTPLTEEQDKTISNMFKKNNVAEFSKRMEEAPANYDSNDPNSDPRDYYIPQKAYPEMFAIERDMKERKEKLKDKVKDMDTTNNTNTTQGGTLGEYILKEYQKDCKRKEMKNVTDSLLREHDVNEEKIKERFLKQNESSCNSDCTFETIAQEIVDLHEKKNHDYGDAAYQSYLDFGLISYVIRLGDKFNRLKSLTKPGADAMVKEESIVDTLKDLAAYSIMAIEALRKENTKNEE